MAVSNRKLKTKIKLLKTTIIILNDLNKTFWVDKYLIQTMYSKQQNVQNFKI